MFKNKKSVICWLIALLIVLPTSVLQAQADKGVEVKGTIVDSGTGESLSMVSVSVVSSGESTSTNEQGEFSITVPNLKAQLIINLPGYTKRNIFLDGEEIVKLSLVPQIFKSSDDIVVTNLDKRKSSEMVFSTGILRPGDVDMTPATSFDQTLQGKVAGLAVTYKSGTPGQSTNMSIRGASSLAADNTPLLFIDGMIHNYTNVGPSLVSGYELNPLDVIDIEDIEDITVHKDGVSYLGSVASGGVININTEQESEASTRIKFSAYGGLSLTPKQQSVLSSDDYPAYFKDVLGSQGLSLDDIAGAYPWLDGGVGSEDYYKYHNNTNWQDVVMTPSLIQKYHFFLKGGDEIATYNLSTGYLNHEGILENSDYNRFNLRVNGKINISQKFSIQPNVKLSFANTEVHNQGYNTNTNPLTASLLKPAITTIHGLDPASGVQLPFIEDVGFSGISNPYVVVNDAIGSVVNYNLLTSIKANLALNDNLNISTLVGIDYGNTHEELFLPDLGLTSADTLKANSPGYFVNEFQSIQNNTMLTYKKSTIAGHSYSGTLGFRYMKNAYKYNSAVDFNTASDAINTLGDGGGTYSYLRELNGEQRTSIWVSTYANLRYNYRDKLLLEGNLAYDGSSALSDDERYSLFPSLAAGYKLLPELKVRGSYSLTGNMFSNIYDYSSAYYVGRLFNDQEVILRENISNPNLEVEKKSTYNLGADLTVLRQRVNLHVDVYQSDIRNLLMLQNVPELGYLSADNGGHLQMRGVELALNTRLSSGNFIWTVEATAAFQKNEIKELDFISSRFDQEVTEFNGGYMLTSVGQAANVFYGYETDGIYQDDAEANAVTGPNGVPMQAGDVRFVNNSGDDNIINSEDMVVIGDPNPDVFGGLFTALRFKRLLITAQVNYSLGNDAYNYVRSQTESMSSYASQYASVNDRWTNDNPSTTMPRAAYGDPSGNTVFSDRWIEDASFVRLKDLTVSYDLPVVLGFRGWSVYMTATNLLTITNYSGFDPEFMISNNMYNKGVDYGQMPQSKKFIVGVKLDL